MLQVFLSPFVSNFWIGRTYIHRLGDASDDAPHQSTIDLRAISHRDSVVIASSPDDEMRKRSGHHDEFTRTFGAWEGSRLIGLCTFAFGKGYRGFYDLGPDDAELTDIFTVASCRAKGTATALIRHGTTRMHTAGFKTLYAKVWHSNHPSARAFIKARWRQQAFFIRLNPRLTQRTLMLEWRPPR
jgi:GNAT superfamily N-acetyltransferase